MINCNTKCRAAVVFLLLCSLAQAQDSLDLKIGQMILIGFPKAEVDPGGTGRNKKRQGRSHYSL
ncbi:MAG: hypothetical protein KatS3mg032_1487 [Cyclobacteriaceae bacterium]|nr:MAG: hypothetical protein KatS3mg032_1487 [Cyclobacteriaceae bacterium]